MGRRVRSWSARTLMVILLAALAVIASAAMLTSCGGAKVAAAATPAAPHSANQILASVFTANPKMKTATATYDVSVSVKAAPGTASSALGPLANGPVSVKGAVTVSRQPLAVDMTADVSVTGIAMQMGVRLVGNKGWIEYLGQWYALPSDALGSLPTSMRQPNASLALMTKLGVDPMKWTRDLTLVGVETLAGKRVYHLKMNLNIPQFVTDLVKIMSSPQFKSLAAGQGTAFTGSAPAAKDLADLSAAIKTADVEIWAAADTFYTTKALFNMNLVLPKKDQKDAGFSSMKLEATVLYNSIDQPVSVKAPASAKPYSELGQSFGPGPSTSSTSAPMAMW